MSETSIPSDDDEFEPSDLVAAAGRAGEYEGTNVCRAAAVAMFAQAAGRDFSEVAEPLQQLGFYERPGVYAEQLQYGRAANVGLDAIPARIGADTTEDALAAAWGAFAESGDVGSAWIYLAGMLDSASERASAAAAASVLRVLATVVDVADFGPFWPPLWIRGLIEDAIAPYDLTISWTDDPEVEVQDTDARALWLGRAWRDLHRQLLETLPFLDVRSLLIVVAWARLRLAMSSSDEVTRELGHTALFVPAPLAGGPPEPVEPTPSFSGALAVSTMVHGTLAWKSSWWRPGGDFHELVLTKHRPNLYNRGARFSWSGALSERQRIIAANDFADWIGEVAPHGVQTVFAHSYGGEVASRAALSGARVHEAVLLSVPAEPSSCALALSPMTRVVDIRTPFDPVLALAGRAQRVGGVEPVLLPWRLGHSASHKAAVWEKYDVAALAGI